MTITNWQIEEWSDHYWTAARQGVDRSDTEAAFMLTDEEIDRLYATNNGHLIDDSFGDYSPFLLGTRKQVEQALLALQPTDRKRWPLYHARRPPHTVKATKDKVRKATMEVEGYAYVAVVEEAPAKGLKIDCKRITKFPWFDPGRGTGSCDGILLAVRDDKAATLLRIATTVRLLWSVPDSLPGICEFYRVESR